MTKRFKILDGALKYLETGTEGNNPIAPANTALRSYQEVKSGERNLSYDRDADSLPEQLLDAKVTPFGVPYIATNVAIVPVSKRAHDNGIAKLLFNAGNAVIDPDVLGNKIQGYFPAQCTVSVRSTADDNDNARSQITGVRYKKKGFKSYTFPYGAQNDNSKERSVRTAIRAALPNTFQGNLQFTSEKI